MNGNASVHVSGPDILVSSADCRPTIYTLSSGENSAFANFSAAIVNHYNVAFSFHRVPIIAW